MQAFRPKHHPTAKRFLVSPHWTQISGEILFLFKIFLNYLQSQTESAVLVPRLMSALSAYVGFSQANTPNNPLKSNSGSKNALGY
jgi:hypothetical protein